MKEIENGGEKRWETTKVRGKKMLGEKEERERGRGG